MNRDSRLFNLGRKTLGRLESARTVWGGLQPEIRRRDGARRVRETAHRQADYRRALARPVDPNVVMYEAFAGKGILCNPEAVFRYLLAAPDMQHLVHVWALKDLAKHRETTREFDKHPRVRFVEFRSREYFETLATAGHLFNNVTFPAEFTKRDDQVSVNTWHGVPMKQMGLDIPDGSYFSRNVVRNFVNSDYLLSSNAYMSQTMYLGSYRLEGMYEGEILELGTPRVDRQWADEAERARVLERLRRAGVELDGSERIVLYAPTWRGSSVYQPTDETAVMAERLERLNTVLRPHGVRVLLKAHQTVYELASQYPGLQGLLVPNDVPTNLVLGLADGLVTDYSSIYFDYVALGRPAFFFIPDRAGYRKTQGLLIEHEELYGSIAVTLDQLAEQLVQEFSGAVEPMAGRTRPAFAATVEKYAPLEDGRASERIVDVLFRGREPHTPPVESGRGRKPRLLMYLGGMHANGITASALNLIRSLDTDRVDVTVMHIAPPRGVQREKARELPPDIRVLERVGGIVATQDERRRWEEALFEDPDACLDDPVLGQIARDEWRRCFGSMRFDHIVDFQGYSPFWSIILQQGAAGVRAVWQHSDLLQETLKEVEGERIHERRLRSLFRLYRRYDKVVAVSAASAATNQRNLADYYGPEKVAVVENLIDVHGIRDAAGLADPVAARPTDGDCEPVTVRGRSRMDDFASLAHLYSPEEIAAGSDQLTSIARWTSVDAFTFVTVGRASPEKNHKRLIDAFARVNAAHPQTELLIIGDGPLMKDNEQHASALGLSEVVRFAGRVDDPAKLLVACDCFVLSSDHEGQPLVILEAMLLGLPTITTEFGSAAGVFPQGGGTIVARDTVPLAAAMASAVEGKLPRVFLDGEKYNAAALEAFYELLGIGVTAFRPGCVEEIVV